MGSSGQYALIAVCFLISNISLNCCVAQTTSEYYLGFFKNWQGNGNLLVILVNTISTPANFTIEAPGVGFQQTGVVSGDSDTIISLPTDLTVVTTNEINEGIYLKIYSSDVLVFGQNEQSSTSDTLFALPYQRLANAAEYVYYAMSAPGFSTDFQGSLLIVGTEDNTTIKLTSTVIALASPANVITANVEHSFVINRLQTFYVRANGDLSGSKVVTDKPVSVFSGHEGARLPNTLSLCCWDNLVEQIPPVTSWGTRFFVMPLATRSSYTIKILTSLDSTNIDIYCNNIEETITLDEGQHYNKTLSQQETCAVISSNPVLVVQFSHSGGEEGDNLGDPMMMIIPDTLQYTSAFSISTIRNPSRANYMHYINLIVAQDFFQPNMIYVASGGNNVSLSSQDWVPIRVNSVTEAYATQVTILEGVADIIHANSAALMTVNVYGFADIDSYGHPGRLIERGASCGLTCLNGGVTDDDCSRCICAAGFTGDNCETNIDDCDPDPCQNGGLCEDGINTFSCICQNGFAGTTCTMGCHLSGLCNDETITIQAISATECCDMGGRSFNDGLECLPACGAIEGDPHFTVPLLSKNILCYSIQGYSGLAFNLVYNKHFVINALFVDTEGDTSEATWIGKLSVVPQRSNAAVVFDSVNQEVVIVGKGNLKASMVKQIIFTENGTVKFTQRMQKQSGNSVIRVLYTNPEARFDVTYYSNHLNVDWSIRYDELHDSHGLMGQFMKKGIDVDTQKEMLIYSDGRDPVPVVKDSAMTGRLCWKAKNYGNQGEGLIDGEILDYVVPNILDVTNYTKKFIKKE